MSIFNVFRKAHSSVGRNSKSLDYRRFKLESLEDRCLLSVNPGLVDYAPAQTAEDFDIDTCIAITTEVPTETQVDQVDTITEANPGDTIYVSVYIKSTDPSVGITGGYCSLYYDVEGFTPGAYIPSAIFPEQTLNDDYNYSAENYISVFGGNPSSMTATYGQTQWALTGTQTFTVADDADGDYTFWNGLTRNKKGVEKESFGFIRSDLGQVSAYKEVTLTIGGDTQADIETLIAITDTIPTATEVDSVESITEANVGDTIYVSVYVKSTDPQYGITGGYCSLYYDVDGFTPGDYIPSAIFPEQTKNDGYDYSAENYISVFGGNPSSMTASYGQTQWALTGTQAFTADTEGDYTFYNGLTRNKKGVEKESFGYIRSDLGQVSAYTEVSLTVNDSELPDITDVTVTGIEKVYDGGFYSIAVEDPQAETDTILYSEDGETYELTYVPAYSNVGTYTTYVKVSRDGYNDYYGSANVVITPADITGVAVREIEKVYDGGFYSVSVEGLQDGDVVAYSLDGETYDLTVAPAYSNVGTYTTYVKVSRENYNDWTGQANVVITPANISGVELIDTYAMYDGRGHSIKVEGLQDGDVVTYSLDAETYDLTENPSFTEINVPDGVQVFVKVSRGENYNDWYGGAGVYIEEGVTVAGIEKVYDGGFYSVSVEGLQGGDVVAYSLDGETYDLTEAPEFVNVGTYTTYVKVSREDYDDWYGDADVVITPADIDDVTIAGAEAVYDGSAYSVSVRAQAGDVIAYSLDGETYDLTEAPEFTNVGTYTTYVKVSRANYNDWYGNADVVITPATIDDVTIDSVDVDYDGNAYSITVNAQDGDVVLYSEDGETYSAENPAYTDVGVNFVYVKVSRANYNDWTGSGTVIINALEIDDVILYGYSGFYDGEAHSITVEDPHADTDEIFYSLDPYTFDLTENPAFTEAGTYEVWVKVRRANHNDWVDSATVTITGDEPVIDDVIVYGYNGVYDGQGHSITVEDPHADTDTILYSLDGETYDLTENPVFVNGYSWNDVYVKVSREGYQDFYGQAVVNIWTKTLTVDGTTAADKVYDGTTDAEAAMGTVSGIVEGDDVTVTIASAEFDSAEAGVRDVTVYYNLEGEDAANYSIDPTVVEGVHIYDTSAADGYTVDAAGFAGLVAGDHIVIDGVSYQIGQVLGPDASEGDVFNAYTNGFAALKNLAAYSGLYDYQDGNSVTINIVSIAPGIDDDAEGITLWRDDVDGEFTQVWTGTVVGYNLGGTAFVQAITIVGNTTWDNQATIYVGDALDISYDNAYDVNTLGGQFIDGIPADDDADGAAATGGEGSVVNINSEGKDINLSMANFDGGNVFTGDFNVVANRADFTEFKYASAPYDEFEGTFTREGFLNLGSETDVQELFILIGDTQAGLTKDTNAAVRLAEGGHIGDLTVQIDAYFTNGYENQLAIDNYGTIDVFNFQTSSSVYKILQTVWGAVMGDTPVPTEQELYYYYYDGKTAASNPFNTGSDENITAFLTALQSGSARYQALANQIIVRMKGMHEVAGDATTLGVINNESGVIGEGLDKLWGFGRGVSFENHGTISCDIDSTDAHGGDWFLNDGGTMGAFASGPTQDVFGTGGGAINGDVNVGAGNDWVTVFDTTVFGGEITFGDGNDNLVLYGSALGAAGTDFSAVLADTPEHVTIYNITRDAFENDYAETTVTIDTAIPDTDVVVDLSLVNAAAYSEYGVAIGADGDLTAVAAYTVKLNADIVLGNGDDKVVIFSGATADNFNMGAELTFVNTPLSTASFDDVTLVVGGTDKLVIDGVYEYELLYDGSNVYLQRTGEEKLADLYFVSVTAADKYTGEELNLDGGVLTSDNVANVTVTFGNQGEAAVSNKYFYSGVRLKNADTGEYILKDAEGNWYEIYCAGQEDVGETGTFSFLLARLAAGNYTLEILLNDRGTVVESDYANDFAEFNFSVAVTGPNLVITADSFSAVDYWTGEYVDLAHGGIDSKDTTAITVTFWNTGNKDVDQKYFYNYVKVYDTEGNVVLRGNGQPAEVLVQPGYVAADGGENSFSFNLQKLPAGHYFAHVILDNRGTITETDKTDNEIIYEFDVVEHEETYAFEFVDVEAVGRASGKTVKLVDGVELNSEVNDITVTYQNVSGDLPASYFYAGVKLQDSEGNYIAGSADSYYEIVCTEGLEEGGIGTFSFLIKALEAGDYTLTLALDQRCAVGDIPAVQTINFTIPSEVVTQCDMVNTGVTAANKSTGEACALDSFTTDTIPYFTVSYQNVGADANAKFFYSSIQIVKSDGTVISNTREHYCSTGLGAGETGSFSFVIGKQEPGTYILKVQLDDRQALDQSDFDNDYAEYMFVVAPPAAAALPEIFADELSVDDLFTDF
ncbi:MAG: hypothetical protein IJG60_08970 [Thermoguttaceae bacterium]|nr:hypothetical protein [Thermoguttaceae bacterium]